MTDNQQGVESHVASGTDVNENPPIVQEEQQPSPQEINWKRANETMAQQSSMLKQREAELEQLREQLRSSKKPSYLDDSEIPTFGEVKEHTNAVRAEVEELKRQLHIAQIEAREGVSVDTLLKKYGGEVPQSIQNAILKTGDLSAAVDACKQTPSYIRDHFQAATTPQAQRIIDNADKPKVAGAVGSSGSLSKNSKIKSMTAEERIQMMHRYSRSG